MSSRQSSDPASRLKHGWIEHLVAAGGPNTLLQHDAVGALELLRAHPAGVARLASTGEALLSQLWREPAAFASALGKARALSAASSRRGSLSAPFVASGLATWSIPGADGPLAPVFLRRCALRDLGGDFAVQVSSQVHFNDALAAYFAQVGRPLDVPSLLAAAEPVPGFSPDAALELLRRMVVGLPDFEVRPSVLVDVFPHLKIPNIVDVQRIAVESNPVLAALAGDPAAVDQVRAEAPPLADAPSQDDISVLDADLEQRDIVEAVRAGSHLVIDAGPGTGKTQTIANTVAALIADGRSTLVVSSIDAALDDAATRLGEAGMSEFVADLRAPIDAANSLAAHDDSPDSADESDAAAESAGFYWAKLHAHHDAMHGIRDPWSVSLDTVQEAVTELAARKPAPRSRVRLSGNDLLAISPARRDELANALTDIAKSGAWTPEGASDPWYGARIVSGDQEDRAREVVARLASGGLRAHRDILEELCQSVGLPTPQTMRSSDDMLELLRDVHGTLESFRPEIFEAPIDQMMVATGSREFRRERGDKSNSLQRSRLQRQARELLRPGNPPQLHGVLVRAARQLENWRAMAGPGARPAAPAHVPEIAAAHEQLRAQLEWLGGRLTPTAQGGDLLDLDFDELQTRLDALQAADDRLAMVPQIIGRLDELRANGLGALLDDLAARKVAVDQVATEFEFVWWTSLLDHFEATDAAYGQHDGAALRATQAAYREADRVAMAANAGGIRARARARIDRASRDLPEQRELLGRGGPLAAALPAAPELVTALKPCWIVRAHEVATTVARGVWFDVVIIDEAAQLPVAEAVSAISRAGQVVLIGDRRQQLHDSETGQARPSALHDLVPLLPTRSLHTHYRGADAQLIAFVNSQLYAGSLQALPSTRSGRPIEVEVVEGGTRGIGFGHAEAARAIDIATAAVRESADARVAIIALSPQQGELLRTMQPERVDIVDAADAVGRVWDTVVVSVGYGLDTSGTVQHRFGPFSRQGGELLLGVVLSRALRRLVVVSSVSGDSLDPRQLRAAGALMLREFLMSATTTQPAPFVGRRRTASTGSVLAQPVARAAEEPTRQAPALLLDLARRLRGEGLVVHTMHGVSAPVDLAVENPRRPGELLVAIEADGQPYAGATSVRERERLRAERLERLGWVHEQVFTRDLFRDPGPEVARLVSAVRAAARSNPAAARSASGESFDG